MFSNDPVTVPLFWRLPCNNVGRHLQRRVVVVWNHDGLLTVVPLDATGAYKDKAKFAASFNPYRIQTCDIYTSLRYESYSLRLDELLIKDMKFLHGQDMPTLAVLYEDNKQKRHVKTYVINLKEKELVKGPWSQPNVESGASLLHSLPRLFPKPAVTPH